MRRVFCTILALFFIILDSFCMSVGRWVSIDTAGKPRATVFLELKQKVDELNAKDEFAGTVRNLAAVKIDEHVVITSSNIKPMVIIGATQLEYLDFILEHRAIDFRKRYLFETQPEELMVAEIIRIHGILKTIPICSIVLMDFFKGKRETKPSKQDLIDAPSLIYRLENLLLSLESSNPDKQRIVDIIASSKIVNGLLCRELLPQYIEGLSQHIAFLEINGIACPAGLKDFIQEFGIYSMRSTCSFTQILQQLSQLNYETIAVSDFFMLKH